MRMCKTCEAQQEHWQLYMLKIRGLMSDFRSGIFENEWELFPIFIRVRVMAALGSEFCSLQGIDELNQSVILLQSPSLWFPPVQNEMIVGVQICVGVPNAKSLPYLIVTSLPF